MAASKMSVQEIRAKIAELDAIKEQLVGSLSEMTDKEKIEALAAAQPNVEPKTDAMEALLQLGYPDMSVKKAKQIIKERPENPTLWPYEMYERAEAFLAAYETKSTVVSSRKGWKRSQV